MAPRFSLGLANVMLGATVGGHTGAPFKTVMDLGFIYIYSGTQPLTPELAASANGSVQLCKITLVGEATGLSFEAVNYIAAGQISKSTSATWQGTVSATGTAAWFRFVDHGDDPNVAATAGDKIRFDGSVGTTSSSDLQLTTTALVLGAPLTIDSFDVTLPVA